MHLTYGAADCSGPTAQRLYTERYPTRHNLSHNFFANLHQWLAERSSFQNVVVEQIRIAQTLAIEHNLLLQVQENPEVYRTHPFHVQRVQSLQPEDYAPRIAFAN